MSMRRYKSKLSGTATYAEQWNKPGDTIAVITRHDGETGLSVATLRDAHGEFVSYISPGDWVLYGDNGAAWAIVGNDFFQERYTPIE